MTIVAISAAIRRKSRENLRSFGEKISAVRAEECELLPETFGVSHSRTLNWVQSVTILNPALWQYEK